MHVFHTAAADNRHANWTSVLQIGSHSGQAEKGQKARASSQGFSLHETGDVLFCLMHVRTDLQYEVLDTMPHDMITATNKVAQG